jgi:hypothetical protein
MERQCSGVVDCLHREARSYIAEISHFEFQHELRHSGDLHTAEFRQRQCNIRTLSGTDGDKSSPPAASLSGVGLD